VSLFEVNDKGNVVVHGHLDRETLSKNFWDSLGVSMSLYKMPEKLRKLAKISDADSFLPVE